MKYLLLFIFPFTLFAVDATLTIKKDVESRTRIALVDGSKTKRLDAFKIFFSDLKISGHFLVDKEHYTGKSNSSYILPILKDKEYILKYKILEGRQSKLLVNLFKASNGMKVFNNSYSVLDKRKVPFLIHKAVSDVNNILNYEQIDWLNRYIVYAVYTSSGRSEIKLADYTFSYKKTILKGGLNLFPKWADKAQKSIYYSAYEGLYPTLYRLNIYTGKKEKILHSEGMIVCSDVSRDERKILLTIAPDGNADIYEYDLASKKKYQITKFSGIDVNGRYIESEDKIVFVSNRLGYPNIFMKSIHSNMVSQVVYHGRNNSACDVHQDKIIYSSRQTNNAFHDNTFNIYLTSANKEDTKPLTLTGNNQFPRFSLSGEVVLYLKQEEKKSLVGFSNLKSNQSLLFPFDKHKIQSIDW